LHLSQIFLTDARTFIQSPIGKNAYSTFFNILPRVASAGASSISTLSPGSSRTKFRSAIPAALGQYLAALAQIDAINQLR